MGNLGQDGNGENCQTIWNGEAPTCRQLNRWRPLAAHATGRETPRKSQWVGFLQT